MAKKLTEADHELRRVVVEQDGVQADVAEILGISVRALQLRLHAEKHINWWMRFKKARTKKRKRLRKKRYYERQKQERQQRAENEARAMGGFASRDHYESDRDPYVSGSRKP